MNTSQSFEKTQLLPPQPKLFRTQSPQLPRATHMACGMCVLAGVPEYGLPSFPSLPPPSLLSDFLLLSVPAHLASRVFSFFFSASPNFYFRGICGSRY